MTDRQIIIGVDPGVVGGAVAIRHYADGRRVLLGAFPWGPPHQLRRDGTPAKATRPWNRGGLAGCSDAASVVGAWPDDTPIHIRVERAWAGHGHRGEAQIIPAAMTAAMWIARACPPDSYEIVETRDMRSRMEFRQDKDGAKADAQAWAVDTLGLDNPSSHVAEAAAFAWLDWWVEE